MFRHAVQIYYEDTDHSGLVYHANYLKYFERAREHLLGVDELVRLLKEDGILCVRVPNDFTPLQDAARAHLQSNRWWIASPDHINYFDFTTLEAFLRAHQLQPERRFADFPMELFLLLGQNYVGNPEVGNTCHQNRVQMELALPAQTRRELYGALAQAGFGRNCVVFARRT